MSGTEFCFNDAVFTYAISKAPLPIFKNSVPIFFDELILNYTGATEVRTVRSAASGEAETEIVVVGLCVDSHGEFSRDEIPDQLLLEAAKGISAIYHWANRLAGRYIICCRTQASDYMFGDATASLQINYCFEGEAFGAASTDHLAAELCGRPISERSKRLKSGAKPSQALPNDITVYESVYALLPNHYLDITRRKAVRVPVEVSPASTEDEARSAIERSAPLIRNIAKEYAMYCDIVCPLTSGYDSRVVFAFLKEQVSDLHCYIFRHKGFTDKTDDMYVSADICRSYGIERTVVSDMTAPKAFIEEIKRFAGPYQSDDTLSAAYTYLSRFRGKTLVNGDIAGQIGKSTLGGMIPNRFATASYFQCKIHNIEDEVREDLQVYIDEIHAADQQRYIYDLFAMENRCGRWAAQSGTLYALASISSLNIFNCREVICLWLAVDRKLRSKAFLHRTLLQETDPRLLDFPFNPDDRTAFMKLNPLSYLAATYVKFFIHRIRGRE